MSVFRKTAMLAVILSAVACRDATAPGPRLAADFVLNDIDGRPVPTYSTPIPESPTVVSSTLHFDFAGRAVLTQHLKQMGGDITLTGTYTYTISGSQIDFELSPPCPVGADCIGPPKGTISGSHLSLDMSATGTGGIYNYSLLASALAE